MPENWIATANVTIDAGRERVWAALTDPELITRYMFGSTVTSDWMPGSTITYAGEYEGKKYEDHGTILEIRPPELLRSTHFSPLGGKPDVPENYHEIAYTLTAKDGATEVVLTQDNNASEAEAEHSAANWKQMLEGLKSVVESTP
ncbi:MAG: hypothetical protein QOH69_2517 [Actinomycetota bacterium]|jgi:uncharacterized protein YndB with AHSA1/START domain|nr:hypothetical protein [Actinomycetota bacterium]